MDFLSFGGLPISAKFCLTESQFFTLSGNIRGGGLRGRVAIGVVVVGVVVVAVVTRHDTTCHDTAPRNGTDLVPCFKKDGKT